MSINCKVWANLGSPKYIAAPMVECSELPFRLLCRRYNTNLCFTPMLHAFQFVNDEIYRKSCFRTCEQDRPLIVQFCSNDIAVFAEAVRLVAPHCDGVDLNLGCPQVIAQSGHYGSFLQEEPDLIRDMIIAAKHLSPECVLSAKIRVLADPDRSVSYALMLQEAGCQFLTVHGRTREQKGLNTGLADWDIIKAIKQKLHIPVIANGNVNSLQDVQRCLSYTGCDAVMSAEGILRNPTLFSRTRQGEHVCTIADEYLKLCRQHRAHKGHTRTHLFRIFYNCLPLMTDLRERLASANMIEDYETISKDIRLRLDSLPDNSEDIELPSDDLEQYILPVSVIHCRPRTCKQKSQSSTDVNFKRLTKAEKLENKIKRKRENNRENKKVKKLKKTFKEIDNDPNRLNKRQKNHLIKERMTQALVSGQKICIDLSMQDNMSNKEISHLSQQLGRLYGANRAHPRPAHIILVGFKKCSRLYTDCLKKHQGFEFYKWTVHERSLEEVFKSPAPKPSIPATKPSSPAPLPSEGEPTTTTTPTSIQERNSSEVEVIPLHDDNIGRDSIQGCECITTDTVVNTPIPENAPVLDDIKALDEELMHKNNTETVMNVSLLSTPPLCQQTPPPTTNTTTTTTTTNNKDVTISTQSEHASEVGRVNSSDSCRGNYLTRSDVIYLTPDSNNILSDICPDKVYIIGGLVDETVQKKVTKDKAEKLGIQTARFPIKETMNKGTNQNAKKVTFKTILAVNQVFDILLEYKDSGDWQKALLAGVPARTGFISR